MYSALEDEDSGVSVSSTASSIVEDWRSAIMRPPPGIIIIIQHNNELHEWLN